MLGFLRTKYHFFQGKMLFCDGKMLFLRRKKKSWFPLGKMFEFCPNSLGFSSGQGSGGPWGAVMAAISLLDRPRWG